MTLLFTMGVNKLKRPFLMVYALSLDLLNVMDQYRYVIFAHTHFLVILMIVS